MADFTHAIFFVLYCYNYKIFYCPGFKSYLNLCVFSVSNDPWATSVSAAPVSNTAGPWDTPAVASAANGNSQKPLGLSVDDDFELLTKRTTPAASTMPTSVSLG